MCKNEDNWRQSLVRGVKSAIRFFSNEEKLEREKWVVRRFLSGLGIEYSETDLAGSEEPTDVAFRQANFQVKELMEDDRRRGDEYKESLEAAASAAQYSDTLRQYSPPGPVPFTHVAELCADKAKLFAETKYGPKERASTDLLFYFNYRGCRVEPPIDDIAIDLHGFRSISVVTNSSVMVLAAESSAPLFIKDKVGLYVPYVEP